MPPKTVTCSFPGCGESVMKSQTYATGKKDSEGNPLRACKTHEGVKEKAEELKEQQSSKQKRAANKPPLTNAHQKYFKQQERKEERYKETIRRNYEEEMLEDFGEIQPTPQQIWIDTHCWVCEQECMSFREANFRILIDMAKAKLTNNKIDFIDTDKIRYRFNITDEQLGLYKKWKSRFHISTRPIIELIRMIQLCKGCQEITGIKKPDEKLLSLKALALIGAAFDTSDLKKSIKIQAQNEVIGEQRKTSSQDKN